MALMLLLGSVSRVLCFSRLSVTPALAGRRVFSIPTSALTSIIGLTMNTETRSEPIRHFRSSRISAKISSLSMSNTFTSWTFDKPCQSMECNSISSATLSVANERKGSHLDDADLIVLGIFAPPSAESDNDEDSHTDHLEKSDEEPHLDGVSNQLGDTVTEMLKEAIKENYSKFKNGKNAGDVMPILRHFVPGQKTKKYVIVGLGKEGQKMEDNFLTNLGKTVASKCDEANALNCAVIFPHERLAVQNSMVDISTGFYTALYSDNRYRTGPKIKFLAKALNSVTIISDFEDVSQAIDSIDAGRELAKGIFLTKDIVNAPHNILNSESLANVAKQIAKESGGCIKCHILDKNECEKRKMGAYLGVARGSETDPKFIHLVYTPNSGKARTKLGVVGKGLLFDTGGYNIKTAMMEAMKFDCGGAAAVLGAARAIGFLSPRDVEVHFIVAACENMINEKAMVPSDVLTASNGKTIEVENTDAEGRLTLADALVFADKEVGCEQIVELATLTGACMVALGKDVAGLWTSSDDLANDLEKAGEKLWRMPLQKEYNKQLDSKIADLKNCGTRYGGATTAALFLQNFVNKKKPFAHIDIAGPVWSNKDGATGYGTKLITNWVFQHEDKGKKLMTEMIL